MIQTGTNDLAKHEITGKKKQPDITQVCSFNPFEIMTLTLPSKCLPVCHIILATDLAKKQADNE